MSQEYGYHDGGEAARHDIEHKEPYSSGEEKVPAAGTTQTILSDREWISHLEDELGDLQRSSGVFNDGTGDEDEGPEIAPFKLEHQPDWMMLFRNACAAILLRAPWSYRILDDSERTAVMKTLVTVFTLEYVKSDGERAEMKKILKELKRQDALQEVQSLLVSYKNNTQLVWKKADRYRMLADETFLREEDHREFKKHCDTVVGQRMRDIQRELAELKRIKDEGRELWEKIHADDSCFGNNLTFVVHSITEESNAPDGAPLTKDALGDEVELSFELHHDNTGFGEVDYAAIGERSEDDPCYWEWRNPASVTLYGGIDIPANRAQILVRVKRPRMCGCWPSKKGDMGKDFFHIPVSHFFQSIEPFNSKVRHEINHMFGDQCGVHVCRLSIPNAAGTRFLEVTMWMKCPIFSHNRVPPDIDPFAREMDDERAIEVATQRLERADAVWSCDHHAAVIKLLDLFGELKDEEYIALELYCDRYLIHKELFRTGTLAVTAMRANFEEETSRDDCRVAVQSIMESRAALMTRTCSTMAEKALDIARERAIDRLTKLEIEVPDPLDAHTQFTHCVFILEKTGLSFEDIPMLLNQRTERNAARTTRQLQKLQHSLGGGDRNKTMSILVELEVAVDRSLLTKAKLVYKFTNDVYREVVRALQFAKESRSKEVLTLALHRTAILLSCLADPLLQTLNAVWCQLILSKAPVNPFGESMGIITHLYKDTMLLVERMSEHEPLYETCNALARVFDDFMPNWIALSQRKVLFWVETTVRQSPLEPCEGGYHSDAVADVLQMFDEVFQFFYECSKLGDPIKEEMTVPAFCGLLQRFAEHFMSTMKAKVRSACGDGTTVVPETFDKHLSAALVGYNSMEFFQNLVSRFWRNKVNEELLRDEGAYDVEMVAAKTSAILSQTKASLSESTDDMATFVVKLVHTWATQYLSTANSKGVSVNDFCDFVEKDFESILFLVVDGLEPKLQKDMVRRCIDVIHRAYHERLLSETKVPIGGAIKQFDVDLNVAVENSITHVAEQLDLPQAELRGLQLSTRHFLHLCTCPSAELIKSLNDAKNARTLSAGETEQLHQVLAVRDDSDAKKFNRTNPVIARR